jgi:uncharacterized protein Usg
MRRDRRRVRPIILADGYRLATAEIIYRMPDHPSLLQSFVWQLYDLPPAFPALRRFLDFWRGNLDGELHSVRVTAAELIGPAKYRSVQHSISFH